MTEEELKSRISELENELDAKEQTIIKNLERIEELEDSILEFQEIISNENSKMSNNKWKRAKDSMLEMELKEKKKEIRELKDKMGFLRKEKIQFQRELEEYTKTESSSTLIRIEEKKEPFETLVKDLQNKINKQQLRIIELETKIKKKGSEILNSHISELHQEFDTPKSNEDNQEMASLLKASPDQLRKRLIKSNKNIKILEEKLENFKKKSKKIKLDKVNSLNKESELTIDVLNAELKIKNDKIAELNNKILKLTQSNESNIINQEKQSFQDSESPLPEKPEQKLNKTKVEFRNLDKQLEYYKIEKAPIKNIELRFRELCNLIEDLKTQNYQQRLEISRLRKE